jgi:hypothetical protein
MKKIKEKMKKVKEWFSNIVTKIKWFISEITKMYSATDSFFSKKRVESGIAFLIAQFGMVFFLIKKIDTMDVYELSIWAGMEFLIAGYTVNQIQKEKKPPIKEEPKSDEPQLLND